MAVRLQSHLFAALILFHLFPHFSFTASPGASTFEVKITSLSEPFSRIWVQILDRQDGSFLVRYRMYASYTDLSIQVLLKNKHVAKSPYMLKGDSCLLKKSKTI